MAQEEKSGRRVVVIVVLLALAGAAVWTLNRDPQEVDDPTLNKATALQAAIEEAEAAEPEPQPQPMAPVAPGTGPKSMRGG